MNARTCGAGAPARVTSEAKPDRGKADTILAAITRSFAVLIAVLQEIFDESAYKRFLERSQLESSPKAYAVFRNENDQAKSQRPRCC